MLCPCVLRSSQLAHVVFVLSMSNFFARLPSSSTSPSSFLTPSVPHPPNRSAAAELSLLHSHLPGFIPRSLSPPMGAYQPPFHHHLLFAHTFHLPYPGHAPPPPPSCSWGLGVGGQGEAARLISWGSGGLGEGILGAAFVLPSRISRSGRRRIKWDVMQAVGCKSKDWGEFSSSWIMCVKKQPGDVPSNSPSVRVGLSKPAVSKKASSSYQWLLVWCEEAFSYSQSSLAAVAVSHTKPGEWY